MAQETILLLHEKYEHVTEPAELLPLAFQVLRFKMTASVRKMMRRGEHKSVPVEELPIATPGGNPEQLAARAEMRRRLLEGVKGLGELCREIFRMKLEGFTFEEIRVQLSVDSINTIYTWDSRCRKSLMERMGGEWEVKR